MKFYNAVVVAAATMGTVVAPAAAQEWQVARQSFAFAGTSLRVNVDANAAGSLQVMRGEPGAVHVASRSDRGFTDAGLSEQEELTLAASGDGPVDYMITVPSGVWVSVQLPGRTGAETIGGWDAGRSFRWHEQAAPGQPAAAAAWTPDAAGRFHTRLFTTYADATPARTVRVPDLSGIRSITVRVGTEHFRIDASRPLTVQPGDPADIEIRPAGPPLDLVVELPAGTADFTLEAGDQPALVVRGDHVAPLCSPVTDQQLSDGQRWVTFTPADGTLRCTRDDTPRHQG